MPHYWQEMSLDDISWNNCFWINKNDNLNFKNCPFLPKTDWGYSLNFSNKLEEDLYLPTRDFHCFFKISSHVMS